MPLMPADRGGGTLAARHRLAGIGHCPPMKS
jgi:hypothetical protein